MPTAPLSTNIQLLTSCKEGHRSMPKLQIAVKVATAAPPAVTKRVLSLFCYPAACWPTKSFVPQCDHRINLGSAPCRQQASQQRNADQQQRPGYKRERVC